MNEPLSSIMTTEIVTLSPNDTLEDARKLFINKKFHHIPIVEEGKLVGVITKSDLWKSGKSFEEYNDFPLSSVMTTRMVHLSPDQRIGVAAELFLENKFGYIPVVEGDILKGIISSFDVMLYSFKKEYPRQFN